MKPNFPTVFTVILAALTATVANAQTEPVDTVKVIDNAARVIITRSDNNTRIEAIIHSADDASLKRYTYNVSVHQNDSASAETYSEGIFAGLPFLSDKKKSPADKAGKWRRQRYLTGLRNIYWGWNFAYGGKGGLRNSFEAGVAEVISAAWTPWRNGPQFRVGLGFGMKRFRAANNMLFAKDGDRLCLIQSPDNASDIKAKWDTWTFHVPLMISQRIYNGLGIAAGVLVNFNTYSKATASCQCDGIRYTATYKGLQQRLLTIEPTAIIGLREGIGFYAKWNPVPVMRQCYGPEFRSWSMGVSINF